MAWVILLLVIILILNIITLVLLFRRASRADEAVFRMESDLRAVLHLVRRHHGPTIESATDVTPEDPEDGIKAE